MERKIEVIFTKNKGPIHFINAFSVTNGNGDCFIKLGCITPFMPREISEIEENGKIEVEPLFVCAITKRSLKAFIELLQSEYEEEE